MTYSAVVYAAAYGAYYVYYCYYWGYYYGAAGYLAFSAGWAGYAYT